MKPGNVIGEPVSLMKAGLRRWRRFVAIAPTVLLAACGPVSGAAPQVSPSAAFHPASALTVTSFLPIQDLQAASLAAVPALPTQFHIDATDQGRTITLTGAYADAARTVLFFHGTGGMRLDDVRVEDDAGLMDVGGSGGRHPAPGDSVITLDGVPSVGAGGLAHLHIEVRNAYAWPPPNGVLQSISGTWTYSIAFKVQPNVTRMAPAPFTLGRWKATIEVLEVTPSVIHLQAIIGGGNNMEVMGPGIPMIATLVDQSGVEIASITSGAGIAVPKTQVNAVTYQNSRIRFQWPRPPAAGTLQLHFQGGGGSYTIPVVIPALAAAS